MPIAQVLMLLYAGMLIENPEKRKQFMGFMNSAGASVEKAVNGFMNNKGGAVNNVQPETTANEEPIEFR